MQQPDRQTVASRIGAAACTLLCLGTARGRARGDLPMMGVRWIQHSGSPDST